MGCQVHAIGKAIRPLFTDPATYTSTANTDQLYYLGHSNLIPCSLSTTRMVFEPSQKVFCISGDSFSLDSYKNASHSKHVGYLHLMLIWITYLVTV